MINRLFKYMIFPARMHIIGAIIGGASIASGLLSRGSSRKAAKAQRKAARANYNLLMENSKFLEKDTLNNTEQFATRGEKFRSSQRQKYGMSGVRIEQTGLDEVNDYKLGVDEIDIKEKAIGKIHTDSAFGKATAKVGKTMGEKLATAELKKDLDNYEGRQTDFKESGGSALLNMQESTTNLQDDLNNYYQQGMQAVYQERRKAEVALAGGQAQAAATQAQGTVSMWNGLFQAGSFMANYYG